MANPPGYVSNNSGPVIPTGYEMLQGQAMQKRKLADALMAQGLAGPGPNARSWAQLLGSLAQAWAGRSLGKDADRIEGNIRNEQLGEYQTFARAFGEDAAKGLKPEEMEARYGGNPYAQERLKPFRDALAKALENKQTFKDPVRLQGPDGEFATYQPNAAGEYAPLPGGLQMAPKIENVNDVAIALSEMKNGTVLPQDADALGIRGPDGKMAINQPLLQAKTQIAKAGAPSISTVLNNQMAKEIPGQIAEKLTKSSEEAQTAVSMLPDIARARAALPKAITGFAANQRLDLARLGQALGFGGDEAIASSQQLLQALGSQMFPILAALRPASDTDVQTAKMMSGGDLTLSPAAIMSAINAAEKAAQQKIERHNKYVDNISNIYGAKDAQMRESVRSFGVQGPAVSPAPAPSNSPPRTRSPARQAAMDAILRNDRR